MTFEDFQKFIDEQDAFFRSLKRGDQTERERIFSRALKIGEEYGELCDEVLASVGDQRKDKLSGAHRDLEGEFADVVITIFMLAKSMNVDIMAAIGKKAPVIREKHNKQLV